MPPIVANATDALPFGEEISFTSRSESFQPNGVNLQGDAVVRIWAGSVVKVKADSIETSAIGVTTLSGHVQVSFPDGAVVATKLSMRRVADHGESYLEFAADTARKELERR